MRGAATSSVIAALLLAGSAGCSGPASTPPLSQTTSGAVSSAASPSFVEGPNDTAMTAPPAPVAPTQDAASSAAAVDVAQRAMTAFARPSLAADVWFGELAPLLTPAARAAYTGTDPAEVPTRAVTGPGRAEASPSAFLAYVVVPSDVGEYRLLLSRESGDADWLVETITAPDGVR